jgi:hypothetical protein
LKGFVTGQGFTYLEPGNTINLSSGYFSPSWQQYNSDGSLNTSSPGMVTSFQLAPTTTTGFSNTSTGQTVAALRVEYHESGSVEGILELANDQIGTVPYVQTNIDRNPNNGNAVWVNGNQFGGVTPPSGQTFGSSIGGYYLGAMYGANSSGAVVYGTGVSPTFNLQGVNTSNVSGSSYTQAGQNAVQLAVSDVLPVQAFQNTYGSSDTNSSTPWFRTPSDLNYGTGNTKVAQGLGVAQGSNPLQAPSILNMPFNASNPRTGTPFGTGPWNTGGLNNLDSKQVAVTATFFDANPGTGLDRINRTDAQWLETTGRLQNGAVFDVSTRDVNSGTRNVAALNTGIDPSWAVGTNDNGNGNLANNSSTGASQQISIGPGLRFSNKTAGGAQLKPTIQNVRMAIGTLSAGDSNGAVGYEGDPTGATPTNNQGYSLRTLEYSDSADGSAAYVVPSAVNIINANYAIYQNEQFVTLKSPDPTAASFNQSQWINTTTDAGPAANISSGNYTYQVPIQGDTAQNSSGALTYDVAQVRDNVLNTIQSFNSTNRNTSQLTQVLNSLSSSSYALINKGFILPQFMYKNHPMDGIGTSSTAYQVNYDPTFSATYYNTSSFDKYTTAGNPDLQFHGTGDVYGGSKGSSLTAFNNGGGTIPITEYDNSNGTAAGGNWLFGNFDQNGVRDFDAVVVTAEKALVALEASNLGTSAFNNGTNGSTGSNSIVIPGLPASLSSMTNSAGGTGATKGDLIVMGDYLGRGTFDGSDLYELAVGASIADSNASFNISGSGANATINGYDHLTVGNTETGVSVMHANGGTGTVSNQTFGDAVRAGKLFKNTALDYLNDVTTGQPLIRAQAAAVLTSSGSSVPPGATDLHTTDAISGGEQYTFDPTGANAFNKADVNRDGTIDFNDAVLVDQYNNYDYTNMTNVLDATEQAPVTGTIIPANLVLLKQSDTSTTIDSSDVAAINSQLTGSGTTNWYGYTVNKTGSGTITWQRSGGFVNVLTSPGQAAFQISSGSVQVLSAMDPFTDNNANAPATPVDTSKSLAITVTGLGSELEYTGTSSTGIQLDRLSSLNISNGAIVSVDAVSNHANRTLLIVGGLTIGTGGALPAVQPLSLGSKIDLNNNDMMVHNGNLSSISLSVKSGYNNGGWNGNGITSTSAANDTTHLTALGVISGSQFSASGGTTFDNAATASTDVLVKYTYYGDATLSGSVTSVDYTLIDGAYLNNQNASAIALSGWYNGDFNYDGVINGSDYTLIDNAFNTQGASLAAVVANPTASIAAQIAGSSSAVPEPTALGLLGVGVGSLLGRRRRRA